MDLKTVCIKIFLIGFNLIGIAFATVVILFLMGGNQVLTFAVTIGLTLATCGLDRLRR